ncbi:MAG: nuclear transport factor 2 family protein [Alphaproteobacteria bacterium]
MKPKVPLEDRVEIEELIARYAWTLDTGDFEGYAGCFTEDGWIEHPPQGRMHGRAGLKKLTDELWYKKPNHYLGRQHNMTQIMMAPENGDVRIKCFWSILQHNVETSLCGVFGLGTWNTLAHKCDDGEWRLKSVGVDIWRGEGVPWVGDKRVWKKHATA